jgi:hypothetical protein
MTLISLGKFTEYVNPQIIEKYSTTQLDGLWHLMHSTDIHRIHTKEAFREFLLRYVLSHKKGLDQVALQFIDDEVVLEGVHEQQYFQFSLTNLIELIGFASSNYKYNIQGSLPEYVQKIGVLDGDIAISSAIKFVDYVMSRIPEGTFENMSKTYPELLDFRERYLKEQNVQVDIYSIPQDHLRTILEMIVDERELEYLEEAEVINEQLVDELGWERQISHIEFAIGVKWGYIELSSDPFSLHFGVDPLFSVEYDNLLGFDFELYSTQEIYDMWNMKNWAHLLPEK